MVNQYRARWKLPWAIEATKLVLPDETVALVESICQPMVLGRYLCETVASSATINHSMKSSYYFVSSSPVQLKAFQIHVTACADIHPSRHYVRRQRDVVESSTSKLIRAANLMHSGRVYAVEAYSNGHGKRERYMVKKTLQHYAWVAAYGAMYAAKINDVVEWNKEALTLFTEIITLRGKLNWFVNKIPGESPVIDEPYCITFDHKEGYGGRAYTDGSAKRDEFLSGIESQGFEIISIQS